MKPMNGIDFLKHLGNPRTCAFCKVPVVMITGDTVQSSVSQVANLGVSGYVAKPFTVDAIKKASLRAVAEAVSAKPLVMARG